MPSRAKRPPNSACMSVPLLRCRCELDLRSTPPPSSQLQRHAATIFRRMATCRRAHVLTVGQTTPATPARPHAGSPARRHARTPARQHVSTPARHRHPGTSAPPHVRTPPARQDHAGSPVRPHANTSAHPAARLSTASCARLCRAQLPSPQRLPCPSAGGTLRPVTVGELSTLGGATPSAQRRSTAWWRVGRRGCLSDRPPCDARHAACCTCPYSERTFITQPADI